MDWSQIVREHGPLVWRTAYRLLSNEADAADCFQNAFLAAWELSAREEVRSWPALLKRLATTRALDLLRERYRETKRFTALPEALSTNGNADQTVSSAEAAELAEELREALARLNDVRLAEVFCLACLEGWSYQQISEHLGITVNHVGVLLNRARSKLQSQLQAFAPTTKTSPSNPKLFV